MTLTVDICENKHISSSKYCFIAFSIFVLMLLSFLDKLTNFGDIQNITCQHSDSTVTTISSYLSFNSPKYVINNI